MVIRHRKYSILVFTTLMTATIIVIHASWNATHQEVNLNFIKKDSSPSIPVEQGTFKLSSFAQDYHEIPLNQNSQRTLAKYYDNRAFPGAPPIIPHSVLSKKGIGGNSCLQCHENGGYVSQFDAYAPISPHPEMFNCKQCHVPSKTSFDFKRSTWRKYPHPRLKNSALPGSPPVIPHTLQMRDNCLSCHAGPAAPSEIRVSHPERTNCRQCHVQVDNFSLLQWDSTIHFTRKPTK